MKKPIGFAIILLGVFFAANLKAVDYSFRVECTENVKGFTFVQTDYYHSAVWQGTYSIGSGKITVTNANDEWSRMWSGPAAWFVNSLGYNNIENVIEARPPVNMGPPKDLVCTMKGDLTVYFNDGTPTYTISDFRLGVAIMGPPYYVIGSSNLQIDGPFDPSQTNMSTSDNKVHISVNPWGIIIN